MLYFHSLTRPPVHTLPGFFASGTSVAVPHLPASDPGAKSPGQLVRAADHQSSRTRCGGARTGGGVLVVALEAALQEGSKGDVKGPYAGSGGSRGQKTREADPRPEGI